MSINEIRDDYLGSLVSEVDHDGVNASSYERIKAIVKLGRRTAKNFRKNVINI